MADPRSFKYLYLKRRNPNYVLTPEEIEHVRRGEEHVAKIQAEQVERNETMYRPSGPPLQLAARHRSGRPKVEEGVAVAANKFERTFADVVRANNAKYGRWRKYKSIPADLPYTPPTGPPLALAPRYRGGRPDMRISK